MEELPQEIGRLPKLSTIHASKTSLKALPPTLCALPELATLILSDCKMLKELPEGIGAAPKLKTLHLNGCSTLAMPPAEVLAFIKGRGGTVRV